MPCILPVVFDFIVPFMYYYYKEEKGYREENIQVER